MVCLGFEPSASEWKVQTKPLSYSVTPSIAVFNKNFWSDKLLCIQLKVFPIYNHMNCMKNIRSKNFVIWKAFYLLNSSVNFSKYVQFCQLSDYFVWVINGPVM